MRPILWRASTVQRKWLVSDNQLRHLRYFAVLCCVRNCLKKKKSCHRVSNKIHFYTSGVFYLLAQDKQPLCMILIIKISKLSLTARTLHFIMLSVVFQWVNITVNKTTFMVFKFEWITIRFLILISYISIPVYASLKL